MYKQRSHTGESIQAGGTEIHKTNIFENNKSKHNLSEAIARVIFYE